MQTNLRALREDRDLKQKEVADFLQVHQTTYSAYELGDLNISMENLVKLADFFDTSTDYLLRRTDYIKPYPKRKTSES